MFVCYARTSWDVFLGFRWAIFLDFSVWTIPETHGLINKFHDVNGGLTWIVGLCDYALKDQRGAL